MWAFGVATDQQVVGDWTGDGRAKIGVFRPSTQRWYLDANGNGVWNPGIDLARGPFGLVADRAVAGRGRLQNSLNPCAAWVACPHRAGLRPGLWRGQETGHSRGYPQPPPSPVSSPIKGVEGEVFAE